AAPRARLTEARYPGEGEARRAGCPAASSWPAEAEPRRGEPPRPRGPPAPQPRRRGPRARRRPGRAPALARVRSPTSPAAPATCSLCRGSAIRWQSRVFFRTAFRDKRAPDVDIIHRSSGARRHPTADSRGGGALGTVRPCGLRPPLDRRDAARPGPRGPLPPRPLAAGASRLAPQRARPAGARPAPRGAALALGRDDRQPALPHLPLAADRRLGPRPAPADDAVGRSAGPRHLGRLRSDPVVARMGAVLRGRGRAARARTARQT